MVCGCARTSTAPVSLLSWSISSAVVTRETELPCAPPLSAANGQLLRPGLLPASIFLHVSLYTWHEYVIYISHVHIMYKSTTNTEHHSHCVVVGSLGRPCTEGLAGGCTIIYNDPWTGLNKKTVCVGPLVAFYWMENKANLLWVNRMGDGERTYLAPSSPTIGREFGARVLQVLNAFKTSRGPGF